MRRIADSFSWPVKGRWHSAWLIGTIAVLLLPIAFIPLLGYAIAATRKAIQGDADGPPPWSLSTRLISDGFWTALVIALLAAPFALAENPLATAINGAHLWHVSDANLSQVYGHIATVYLLALPLGLLLLLLLPNATRRFAESGRPVDLFNFPQSILDVRNDFATWNVAAAAIVTGWTVGLACTGLACVGLLPGVFYAILVSAHACAALGAKTKTTA